MKLTRDWISIQTLVKLVIITGVMTEKNDDNNDINENKEDIVLTGENVCSNQVLETTQVNVTYLESVKVKKHSLCFKPPFICADYVNTMKTRWRLENVTRLVTKQQCCPGYQVSESRDTCVATCLGGCEHGQCTQPEVCTCDAGFSGSRCHKLGCPRGTWGPNCGHECPCYHGGWCDPVTGDCNCPPGYLGDLCQDTCPAGTWGEECDKTCDCDNGELCHHVTGTCSPCKVGSYGDNCQSNCTCNSQGTELCSHLDGKCFCKGNWFGKNCDLHCPFGYSNDTCYKQARDDGTCQCANDLYICDPEQGCVCPGDNCGVELLDNTVYLSPYSDQETQADQQTATISLSVILVAGVAIVLVVIYYKRRMSVMRKDIKNRSVYYCDGNSPDTSDRSYDLVVRDTDHNTTTISNISNVSNVTMLNNVRLNLDSQQLQPTRDINIKNVNVNNSIARAEETRDTTDGASGYDVNLYPKYEKSNLNQHFQSKVVKADLEIMIRNNLACDNSVNNSKTDDDDDGDSVCNLKVNLKNSES